MLGSPVFIGHFCRLLLVSDPIMMLDFLNGYQKSVSLDDEKFRAFFTAGVKKSDFLLFEDSTVCEFKEIENFDVVNRVEKIANKGIASGPNSERDFYRRINSVLSKANQQIKETKNALGKPDALGLVMIENLIPTNLSVLALIGAADRKMANGLEFVDAVLCLDFANTFTDEHGSQIQPAQLVTRATDRSEKLYRLVGELLDEFSKTRNTTLHRDFDISNADQNWVVDSSGRYKNFKATLNKR